MRVEELEAVCHAASFETSLRRAMAQTSPVCSVSASTDSNDSSQSFVHADHDESHANAATSSFQFGADFRASGIGQQNGFGPASQRPHGHDDSNLQNDDRDDDADYFTRRDSDSVSQSSSSETEISGLKQQRHEWEAEREELLKEMGNLRSDLLASR